MSKAQQESGENEATTTPIDWTQDAARFIKLDIRAMNSLLLAKYCCSVAYLCMCLALLYGARSAGDNGELYQSRARYLLLVNTGIILASLGLFSVTRCWPSDARRWLGWLPVLALRWNWLAIPCDRELQRYVCGAIDWRGDEIGQAETTVNMRRAALGLTAASVWSTEMTFNAVGLSYVNK